MKFDGIGRGIICLSLLPALFACQSKPTAPASGAQEESPQAKDRKELVLQSKGDWKPAAVAQKLNVMLILEKGGLVTGDKVRYRLEIKNSGRNPVAFLESAPSFIKDGSFCAPSDFAFFVTPPGGAEQPLPCEPSAAAGSGLDLTLASGEYLLTRPEGPASRFRELRTPFHFDALGTYRLKLVYTATGLRVESQSLAFDMVKKKEVRPHAEAGSKPASQPASKPANAGTH